MRSGGAGSQSGQAAHSALTAAAPGPGGTVSTGRSGSDGSAPGGATRSGSKHEPRRRAAGRGTHGDRGLGHVGDGDREQRPRVEHRLEPIAQRPGGQFAGEPHRRPGVAARSAGPPSSGRRRSTPRAPSPTRSSRPPGPVQAPVEGVQKRAAARASGARFEGAEPAPGARAGRDRRARRAAETTACPDAPSGGSACPASARCACAAASRS